jgi:hypothetical protein
MKHFTITLSNEEKRKEYENPMILIKIYSSGDNAKHAVNKALRELNNIYNLDESDFDNFTIVYN